MSSLFEDLKEGLEEAIAYEKGYGASCHKIGNGTSGTSGGNSDGETAIRRGKAGDRTSSEIFRRSATTEHTTRVDIYNHHPFHIVLVTINRQLDKVRTFKLIRLYTISTEWNYNTGKNQISYAVYDT